MLVNKQISTLIAAIATISGLSACNVDLTSGNVNGKPLDEYMKTNIGTISRDGNNIMINGINYDLSKASITLDGLPGDVSQLKSGMLVSVTGVERTDGTGSATKVEYYNEVEGSVLSSNVATDGTVSLNVLGQTVHIDDNTVFESYDVADLSTADIDDGNIVEVSGHSSGDGEIWATRIEVKTDQYYDGSQEEVKGYVSNLTNDSFNIGNLSINYGNAVLDNDFMGSLSNGQYVEIKSNTGLDINGNFVATEIDLVGSGEKEIPHENDEQVETKGVVTKIVSGNELEINGSRIQLSNNLNVSQQTLSNLAEGQFVQVEGYVDKNGVFYATKLELANNSESELDSDTDSEGTSDNDNSIGGDDNENSESTEQDHDD